MLTSNWFLSCFLPCACETLGWIVLGDSIVIDVDGDRRSPWWQDWCGLFVWSDVTRWESLKGILSNASSTFHWHSRRSYRHISDWGKRSLSTLFPYLRAFVVFSNWFLWELLQILKKSLPIFFLLGPLENIEWTFCFLKPFKLSSILFPQFSLLLSFAFTFQTCNWSWPHSFIYISKSNWFGWSVWPSTQLTLHRAMREGTTSSLARS